MKNVVILAVAIFSLTVCSYSQNDTIVSRFGVFGGLNYNIHSAEFSRIPDCPNCSPGFEDGTGISPYFGLLYEYPLSQKLFLSLRGEYFNYSGLLERTEQTTIIVNGTETPGEFTHRFDASVASVGLDAGLSYNLFSKLFVGAGIKLGYNITGDYDQKEEITQPELTGTFLDENGNDSQLRTRNEFTGTMADLNILNLAPEINISYELPLNKENTLIMAPELRFAYGIGNINTAETVDKWNYMSASAGIAIKYRKFKKQIIEEYEKIFEIDTIEIETETIAKRTVKQGVETTETEVIEEDNIRLTRETVSRIDTLFIPITFALDGNIRAVGVDSLGNEIENPKFVIEEFVSNRLDPLLNYIFFDEGESELRKEYKLLNSQDAGKFTVNQLFYDNILEIYYNILNIVGKRMQDNPNAKLTITGCNAGTRDEKGDLELSRKRAETVRDYLVNIWGIDESRLAVEKRNLPDKESTPIKEEVKMQENRRVELASDNEEILKPIFIEKVDRTSNPPIARFKPTAESEAGLAKWHLTANQTDISDGVFEKEGTGEIPGIIDWNLDRFQKIIPKKAEPITYSLLLEDKKGNTKEIKEETMPVDVITVQKKRTERIGDNEVERFSLILFDFNKSNIEGSNQEIIDFISSRIKPESKIEITGYTDKTGDDDYNQKLSERRAKSTQKALKRNDAVTQGIGEAELLYDNDFPEGRFYCRTVNITVTTPIK